MKIPPRKFAQTDRALHRGITVTALAVALLVAAQDIQAQGGPLKPHIIGHDSFSVVGIEIRTNNSAGDIPRLWDRFFKEGIAGKIPNRIDNSLVVVYSRYASDHNGDYDYLIGARAKDGSTAPDGMVVKVVPKARYTVVTTAKGPVGQVVSEAWKNIWSMEDTGGLGGKRTYKTDFEVYDQRASDPNKSQVDIYVGVE